MNISLKVRGQCSDRPSDKGGFEEEMQGSEGGRVIRSGLFCGTDGQTDTEKQTVQRGIWEPIQHLS
jgi:hypothetical protein